MYNYTKNKMFALIFIDENKRTLERMKVIIVLIRLQQIQRAGIIYHLRNE